MSLCILCGNKAVINQQEKASRTIYNCPLCGVYVVSDLVEKELRRHAMKVSAFLIRRKLRAVNEIVFITFDNNKVDKEYLQMTVDQIVEVFPKTLQGQLEAALENLALCSDYPGDEIRVDRQEFAPMFCVVQPGLAPFSFTIKALQELGWITANFFGSGYFPCTVSLTTKGWMRVHQLRQGKTSEDVALITLPHGNSEAFHVEVSKACRSCGYRMVDAAVLRNEGRISNGHMAEVRTASVVVCDLTDGSSESYYLAGMAHALRKSCILTCHERKRKKIDIDREQVGVLLWDTPETYLHKLTQAIRAHAMMGLKSE